MKQIPNEVFFVWLEDEIANNRPVRFRLKGNSMFPLLRNNKDEVVLYPCIKEELKPMDVVLFMYKGRHLLHRIIQRKGDDLLLQGDGSYVAKEVCTIDDVIGKVQFVVRPTERIISVDARQWRWSSVLWQKIGILRRPILRFCYFCRFHIFKS